MEVERGVRVFEEEEGGTLGQERGGQARLSQGEEEVLEEEDVQGSESGRREREGRESTENVVPVLRESEFNGFQEKTLGFGRESREPGGRLFLETGEGTGQSSLEEKLLDEENET
jgi:hypothetical protein